MAGVGRNGPGMLYIYARAREGGTGLHLAAKVKPWGESNPSKKKHAFVGWSPPGQNPATNHPRRKKPAAAE